MEQLKKTTTAPTSTPPTIRVKLQTGANNSVEFNSSGVESSDVCNTIEYLSQASLKTSQELERMYFRNSALFMICTTLILGSLAFALGISAARYLSTVVESSPRHQQYEQN
jgi:hypothetical protein